MQKNIIKFKAERCETVFGVHYSLRAYDYKRNQWVDIAPSKCWKTASGVKRFAAKEYPGVKFVEEN